MPVSPERFLRQLVDSGLMSADEVRELQVSLPAHLLRADDSQDFARELVARKKLTPYQAAAAYQGKANGLVFGTYVVLEKLGQGGMGTVFKAEHRRMKRVVALKVMSQAAVKSPDAVKRFHREVEAAAKLTHPHIVAALDADEAGGVHFLVMEYVEGSDLAVLVKKNGPLPVDLAVQYILQAARGLEHAHREGVVHRDVKPANLLLDKNGTVKILDMGLARLTDSATGPAAAGLTQSGSIMGTVDYMSPEQALHTKYADRPADIYSLGCSLYYLLTGKPVYSGESLMEKLLAHREQPIPSLCRVRADIPPALDAVFCRMIAKKPEDRYASMTDVIHDLEACLAGEVVSASSHVPGAGLANPFRASESGTMGSEDPAVQEFLRAISPAASATDVRASAGTAPASETMASRLGEQTHAGGFASRVRQWGGLPPQQKWLLGGSGVVVLLIVGSLVWSMTGDKRTETAESQPKNPKPAVVKAGWQGWPADAPPPAIAPFDATKAKQHQAAWAKYLKVGVEYSNSLGMKFVLIPPGEFTMGSTPVEIKEALKLAGEDKNWQEYIKSEGPQHKVILTQPVYLGVHEVTQAQYEKVMGQNPSSFAATGHSKDRVVGLDTSTHPVDRVSWNDAADFCTRLSEQEKLTPFYIRLGEIVSMSDGTGYRLLTEAEWEFGCRAGTTTKYWIGEKDEPDAPAAWFNVNSGIRPHAVGELRANPFGLHDMHGNLWEWIQDWWVQEYYGQFQEEPAVNPRGPANPDSKRWHISRGGCWSDTASSASRAIVGAMNSDSSIGFRVALAVDAVKKGATTKSVTTLTDPAFQKWMQQVAGMAAAQQVEAVVRKLQELNPGFDGKVTPKIDFLDVTELQFITDNVTDISPVRALAKLKSLILGSSSFGKGKLADLSPLRGMSLTQFTCGAPSVVELSPLEGMPLTTLDVGGTKVSDLSPLHGMPLTNLVVHQTQVSDLSPLKDMKLNILSCYLTQVSDLSPLEGMPLTSLACNDTRVSDLTPLKDIKLSLLWCRGTLASDLSPLQRMPLKSLTCDFKPERDAALLRSIKTLETINGKPVAEFWKEVEAGHGRTPTTINTPNDPAFTKWMQRVAALSAEKQVEAVARKLKELNPGFDGKVTPKMDFLDVAGLQFATENVTDISPVRALARLKSLKCGGSGRGKGKLADLSPLRGLSLTELFCDDTQVSDLSPLKGMPLTSLSCNDTSVSELSPLKNMPLTNLGCYNTQVSDLTPLKGMPLASLNCSGAPVLDLSPLQGMPLTGLQCDGTKISDLSPLKGIPLTALSCSRTSVSDLSPLKGMPLTLLLCEGTQVSDLSPIKDMPLTSLSWDFKPERDTEILRSIKSLKTINGKRIAEFWREVEEKQHGQKP